MAVITSAHGKTTIGFVMMMVVCTLLTGCSNPINLVWFNNTGSQIKILKNGRTHPESAVVVQAGASVRVNPSKPVVIYIGNSGYVYPQIPMSYAYASKDSSRLFKIQIETNGVIHYLQPTATQVSSALPSQAPGYPLKAAYEFQLNSKR